MNTILQKYLVLILLSLIWFMTSYFGHAHIHLAGEEKFVDGNIAKLKDFFQTFIITFPQRDPGWSLHGHRSRSMITSHHNHEELPWISHAIA